MQHIIEKNIPLPTARGDKNRYPFADMEVGDSYAVPAGDGTHLRSAAHAYAKRHDIKFATRLVADQVRVWRTA